jgi:hypothetical protein
MCFACSIQKSRVELNSKQAKEIFANDGAIPTRTSQRTPDASNRMDTGMTKVEDKDKKRKRP